MKPTTDETREFLLGKFVFPCRIVISLKRKEDGYCILIRKFRNKSKKLENVKFDEVQTFMLDGFPMIPIRIDDFENVDDLIEAVDAEREIWTGTGEKSDGR